MDIDRNTTLQIFSFVKTYIVIHCRDVGTIHSVMCDTRLCFVRTQIVSSTGHIPPLLCQINTKYNMKEKLL